MTHPYYSASKAKSKLAFSMQQFTDNLPMFAKVEAMDMDACRARFEELSSGTNSEHLLEMNAIAAKLHGEASVNVLPVYRMNNREIFVATLVYAGEQPPEAAPEDLEVVESFRSAQQGKPVAYLTMADLLDARIVTPSGELLERKNVPTLGRLKSLAKERYEFASA